MRFPKLRDDGEQGNGGTRCAIALLFQIIILLPCRSDKSLYVRFLNITSQHGVG